MSQPGQLVRADAEPVSFRTQGRERPYHSGIGLRQMDRDARVAVEKTGDQTLQIPVLQRGTGHREPTLDERCDPIPDHCGSSNRRTEEERGSASSLASDVKVTFISKSSGTQ